MQPEENDTASLWDMRRAALDVSEFVAGRTFQDFIENRQLRLAVEAALRAGEAVRLELAAVGTSDEHLQRVYCTMEPEPTSLRTRYC